MTKEEAKANQDRIAKDFDLSYWYGTNCDKCCGVFPKFRTFGGVFPKFRTFGDLGGRSKCYYECEVCGKKTEPFDMPWQSERAWNRGEFVHDQLRWF